MATRSHESQRLPNNVWRRLCHEYSDLHDSLSKPCRDHHHDGELEVRVNRFFATYGMINVDKLGRSLERDITILQRAVDNDYHRTSAILLKNGCRCGEDVKDRQDLTVYRAFRVSEKKVRTLETSLQKAQEDIIKERNERKETETKFVQQLQEQGDREEHLVQKLEETKSTLRRKRREMAELEQLAGKQAHSIYKRQKMLSREDRVSTSSEEDATG